MAHAFFPTHSHCFDGPISMEEQRPSQEVPTWYNNDRPEFSGQSSSKLPRNGHSTGQTAQDEAILFVVMCFCSQVVLSYLDAGFEPRCCRKVFWTACLLACCCCCLLLLLLKRVAYPWSRRNGVKSQQGKPSLVITSRRELGRSWVLVLRNTLEITVEERPLPLEMCLDGKADCLETRLKKGSFTPHNGPLCRTTAWYMPC